jgi:putative RNA 2'-phosphotransferase
MKTSNQTDLVRISKRMSYVLRHAPQAVGLTLDAAGWVGVPDLLAALGIDRVTFDAVVAGNDKQRFAVERDDAGHDRVRASQGHSVPVALGLDPVEPPTELFHGTPAENLPSILRDGLRKGRRQHVHLSIDVATARTVGMRRHPADVAILRVEALAMVGSGFTFYRSANGVWLTETVPPGFITRLAATVG